MISPSDTADGQKLIRCPRCHRNRVFVIDSRPSGQFGFPSWVRRRRYCCNLCNTRWTTTETHTPDTLLTITQEREEILSWIGVRHD